MCRRLLPVMRGKLTGDFDQPQWSACPLVQTERHEHIFAEAQ